VIAFGHEQAGTRTRNAGQEGDANVEKLWLQEAERRLAELKTGKAAGIPAQKVIRRARSMLR
jgi:hypothetical protein